jgi:4-carboxymuconolactone decarboxylase
MPDARVPLISRRDEVAPEHRAAFDAIAQSRGRVAGPFGVLLHSPEVAKRAAHLGAYLRFESPLAGADRELAILATARTMDCRYEWAAHVPLAAKAGVRAEAIAAIRARQVPGGLTPTEAEIVAYATGLLGAHRVEAGLFEGLRKRLGPGGMVDLTATVGYYAMLACTLNAFDVKPDPGADLLPV